MQDQSRGGSNKENDAPQVIYAAFAGVGAMGAIYQTVESRDSTEVGEDEK